MSKWAPEPWHAFLGDDCTIVDANGDVIASVVCIDRSMDRATARLMTSAPRLFAELRAALDVLRIAEVEGEDHGDRCRGLAQLRVDAARAREHIRAAMAEAEGK